MAREVGDQLDQAEQINFIWTGQMKSALFRRNDGLNDPRRDVANPYGIDVDAPGSFNEYGRIRQYFSHQSIYQQVIASRAIDKKETENCRGKEMAIGVAQNFAAGLGRSVKTQWSIAGIVLGYGGIVPTNAVAGRCQHHARY